MDKVYTQRQIDEAWQEYHSQRWYRVSKGGKVFARRHPPDESEQITKCDMCKVCDLISFPKFLDHWNG